MENPRLLGPNRIYSVYTIETSSDQCVMPGGDYVYTTIELRHGSSDSVCAFAGRCRPFLSALDKFESLEAVCERVASGWRAHRGVWMGMIRG